MVEFSAVVHTYNRRDTLVPTLESVTQQHYRAAEVIVIDDGSTDNSENVVKSGFPGIIYVKIENSGCGAARKAGAERAKKDWIAFCDDDDIWLPDHLERRAKLIERFPEAEFTFSNFNSFGPTADPNYVHFDCAPQGWWDTASEIRDGDFVLMDCHAFRHFLTFNPAYPSTWAVKRDSYHNICGINSRYSRWQAEDTDFSRRCALRMRAACDQRVTASYRRHASNMSARKSSNLLCRAKIVSEQLRTGLIPIEYREDVRAFISNSYKMAYLTAFWDRDFASMKDIMRDSTEARGDWNLRVRHLYATALNCFRHAGLKGKN